MLSKNQEFALTIDGMSNEGTGVGHHDGLAVFVANTAVGDTVLCHIIKAKKNYAVGKAMAILTPSPDRIESDCSVSNQCGGCCYRSVSYDAELRYKQQKVEDAFSRIGHLEVPLDSILGSGQQEGYRNKAQYPVQDANAALLNRARGKNPQKGPVAPKIGFYAANSHRVIPCDRCLLQPAEFERVVQIVRDWMVRYDIRPYDENTHKGLLRHLYIRQGHYSKELMVCLVVNGENVPHTFSLLETLKEEIAGFCSLVLNYNTKKTNVIMGKDSEVLYGDGYIRDRLLDCTFRISPLSFYQVNTPQAETLYRKAAEYAGLTGNEVLLDLYCGTGTIGLTMAKKAREVYGVEIVPEAVEDARRNAGENGISNATFLCGDAALAAATLRRDGVRPDVILVDPPRKGLAEELVGTIDEFSPDRVVYVSCDPATLARDCARFAERGWAVQRACPVDLFPRTAHVETVVLMSRVDGK